MKGVGCGGPTIVNRYRTEFSPSGDLAFEISAPVAYS